MAPKNKKPKAVSSVDTMQHFMKMVTVDQCISCTQQCQRGLAYIDKMSHPGAIGHGVPCILTKGKPTMDNKKTSRKK